MEAFLREGMDFQAMSSTLSDMTSRSISGDAHFFEDTTSPAKVREYLDSAKV